MNDIKKKLTEFFISKKINDEHNVLLLVRKKIGVVITYWSEK